MYDVNQIDMIVYAFNQHKNVNQLYMHSTNVKVSNTHTHHNNGVIQFLCLLHGAFSVLFERHLGTDQCWLSGVLNNCISQKKLRASSQLGNCVC